jgi:hypothetical protein
MTAMLVIMLSGVQVARAQEAPGQEFDDYVNKALKQWEVPGVAIAIVKNDQIVFARGYGLRKLGDPTPVNEKTLFAIGSASKAFTAAAIGMLMDEGKLKWDDPAAKHLPGFQLFDPYASRELTVRDLLCHRSGLERGDLLWYGSDLSRDEILRRIRYLKPSTLSEHHVPRRRSDRLVHLQQGVGRLHQRADIHASRHGLVNHQRQGRSEVGQCRDASCQDRREGSGDRVAKHRQHRTRWLDQLKRSRHGAVGAASAW